MPFSIWVWHNACCYGPRRPHLSHCTLLHVVILCHFRVNAIKVVGSFPVNTFSLEGKNMRFVLYDPFYTRDISSKIIILAWIKPLSEKISEINTSHPSTIYAIFAFHLWRFSAYMNTEWWCRELWSDYHVNLLGYFTTSYLLPLACSLKGVSSSNIDNYGAANSWQYIKKYIT